jgi:hypothetical protein
MYIYNAQKAMVVRVTQVNQMSDGDEYSKLVDVDIQ